MFAWSHWRRWHQAWARYYHYRRRRGPASQVDADSLAAASPDVLTVVWGRLAAVLPPTKRTGRPYAHDRRVVLEAILYVMETGCSWATLPVSFPPWQTVYAQFDRWRKTGVWDTIWRDHEQPDASGQLQL
jgi:hypothetical protein